MKISDRTALALAASMLLSAPLARAADPYAPQPPIHIGGAGRWDYARVDPDAHRLYVTRSNHTQGIDLTTGKVVIDVMGRKRSHGVAAVDSVGRGYITDGGAGVIAVFDLKSGHVLGNVAAADDADGEIYDAGTNKILATCGDSGVVLPAHSVVAEDQCRFNDESRGRLDVVQHQPRLSPRCSDSSYRRFIAEKNGGHNIESIYIVITPFALVFATN